MVKEALRNLARCFRLVFAHHDTSSWEENLNNHDFNLCVVHPSCFGSETRDCASTQNRPWVVVANHESRLVRDQIKRRNGGDKLNEISQDCFVRICPHRFDLLPIFELLHSRLTTRKKISGQESFFERGALLPTSPCFVNLFHLPRSQQDV